MNCPTPLLGGIKVTRHVSRAGAVIIVTAFLAGLGTPMLGQSLHERILQDEANDRANELIRQMRELKNRDWGYHSGNEHSERASGPTQAQLNAAAARERRTKATALNLEGIAYWKDNNWDYAGEKFQQAYANNPDSKEIVANLANCRNQQGLAAWEEGDWERAANMFSSAVLHNPKSKVFQANLVLAQQKQEEQRRKYREQLQDKRQWDLAYSEYSKGKSSADNGDYAEALNSFRIASQHYPGEHAYVKNVAWAYSKLGDQAWKKGDTNTALDLWINALQVDPDNTYVREVVPQVQAYLRQEQETKSLSANAAAADSNVRQETQKLSAALVATPATGGLDYGDLTSGPFGSKEVKVSPLSARGPVIPGTNDKAGDQLLSAAAQAVSEGDLTINYDRGGAPPAGTLVFHTADGKPSPMDLSRFSERAKKDSKIVSALGQLTELQAKRAELDAQRSQLAKERNLSADNSAMNEASSRLQQKEADYQVNLQAIADKEKEIENRHREIDTEIADEPDPGKK